VPVGKSSGVSKVATQPSAGTADATSSGSWNSGGIGDVSYITSSIPTAANPNNVEKTTQKELIRKFLEMSPQERIGIGNRLKGAGYQVGGLTGQATKDLRNAYLKAYDDLNQEILIGSKETGVFIFAFSDADQIENWQPLTVPKKINAPLIMACSRSHHSGSVLSFINELKTKGHEVDYLKKGSALKFFDLALGKADVYPRFAPTMEWDIAAGQAILEALGGSVVHAETGEPLYYNKANLVNPYFIARTALFQ
jgi:hypothetical protein